MKVGMDLTVGHVSSIIAVGVVVVRTLSPSLLALLFLGALREHNGSARANAISWWVNLSKRPLRGDSKTGTQVINQSISPFLRLANSPK
jgi:hypothetical protein